MRYDVVVLTDPRYINPKKQNVYVQNVLQEDRLVLEALQKQGLHSVRVSWDDPDFNWSSTQYALFRTTWDYFDRFTEFSKWLESTSHKTQFINSSALIHWNIDKHYLHELSTRGVNIPKTYFVEQGTRFTLKEAYIHTVEQLNFEPDTFILKPCVSGAARHTYKIDKESIVGHEAVFKQLIAEESVMLQEFQKNIVSEGEMSLMVFNGVFTHAVLKIAKPGDFRVQDDFGGTVHPYKPTQEQIDFARKVVHAAPELPMYARVDIFRDNSGNWALAELEIFEPELWFRLEPQAAEILAMGITKKYFS